MAEETATTTETETVETTEEAVEDRRVPYERFEQVNKKAKAEAEARKKIEKDLSDLRSQMEEREHAGLPELEQLKKRLEQAEKRAEENERKAQESDAKLARSAKERWITAAAQAQNFADPSDAAAFVDLDSIEDEKDAERAVKRLAGQKKHLLKAEEPALPGRVLQNGQSVEKTEAKNGGHLLAEAQALAEGLKQFASKD